MLKLKLQVVLGVVLLLVANAASAVSITNSTEIDLTVFGLEETCDGAIVSSRTSASENLHLIIVDLRHWYLTSPSGLPVGTHLDSENDDEVSLVVAQHSYSATVSQVAVSLHAKGFHEYIICLPGGGILEDAGISQASTPCL